MCREIRYPEQWRILKKQGARVIFHLNNAINQHDSIWENLIITRAYENQVFICSVNVASDSSQHNLSSMLISPSGSILFKSNPQIFQTKKIEINLKEVSNSFIEQARDDLVEVVHK
jgi:predicted amidohydrolase